MDSNRERQRLLFAQHRRLRPLLIALDKGVSEVLSTAGDAGVPELQILRETIGPVRRELEAHFALEESLLDAALPGMDDWGVVRLGRLRTAHKHQRKLLGAICADPPLLSPHSLARVAAALAGEVLAGMVDEERDLEAAGLFDEGCASESFDEASRAAV
jgi:hypothetical protein